MSRAATRTTFSIDVPKHGGGRWPKRVRGTRVVVRAHSYAEAESRVRNGRRI